MRAKGSLTVEAAFTVPLSFFAVVVFLNLFLFLQVQMRVQKEIASIGNELMSVGTLFSKAQAAGSEATASDLSDGGNLFLNTHLHLEKQKQIYGALAISGRLNWSLSQAACAIR